MIKISQVLQNIFLLIKEECIPIKKKSERILYLEFLKIVAASLVVFYHYAYYRLDYGFLPGRTYIPNFNRVIMSFASCSVPLFFLVNGTLLFSKRYSWNKTYYKAVKILILMVAWSFVGFPSWFFRTLVIIYLVYPFLSYIKLKNRCLFVGIEVGLFIMPFLYNLGILVLKALQIKQIGIVQMNSLHVTGLYTMYGLLYFMLGSHLYERKRYSIVKSMILIIMGWGFVVFECVIYTNLNQVVYDGVNHAFPTIGALMLSVGVYMISTNFNLNSIKKSILWCSSGVLPIYLMHMGCINIIDAWIGFVSVNLIEAVFVTIMIIICCVMIGKVMQRIPVICSLVKM